MAGEGGTAPPITALLFDLDGTLYPIENGYEAHVRRRVLAWMVERLGCASEEAAQALWAREFPKYNQTLRALRAAPELPAFDAAEYWSFIRAGTGDFLARDEALRATLASLPQRKWVLTNAAEAQAREALRALGVEDCFEGVLGADLMGDRCKPEREAFDAALRAAGIEDPSRCAMFEDSHKNLVTAKTHFGMTTVMVRSKTAAEEGLEVAEGAVPPCVDALVSAPPREEELRRALPGLWG
mmetsp:Transcript_1216/g.4025  ORF Transcript_1216/g.4025 Transcript_1216/m.4025 type:complete len:241 (+) Transcript_1216:43-765(+)